MSLTDEAVTADAETQRQVGEFRDTILNAAIEKQYSFDVVFNALNQVVVSFAFDLLMLRDGAMTEEQVNAVLNRFALHNQKAAATVFANMQRVAEQVEQELAQQKSQE